MDLNFQVIEQDIDGQPNTIASRVFKVLRNAIVTMKLLPGNSLSEAEVAKQLDVSRQPVREAFIQLSKIGMVNIIPQKGTFVVKINCNDVENARFIREAIELALVERACTTATAENIDKMFGLITSQRESVENSDQEQFLILDDAFHYTIALSADCPYGWHIVENLKAQIDRVRYLSLPEATPNEKIVHQHLKIAEAIQKGDKEEACAAVKVHLGELLVSLPKLAEKYKDLFTENTFLQS